MVFQVYTANLIEIRHRKSDSPFQTKYECKLRAGRPTVATLNYKPQAESRQQHFALYIKRHLCLIAIMIEVTSRYTECNHFNLDYSQMPAVAQHCYQPCRLQLLPKKNSSHPGSTVLCKLIDSLEKTAEISLRMGLLFKTHRKFTLIMTCGFLCLLELVIHVLA